MLYTINIFVAHYQVRFYANNSIEKLLIVSSAFQSVYPETFDYHIVDTQYM